jgi:hypothetical protein
LPSSASAEAIASTIAERDRPVAVLSLMHAEEWTLAEPKRIQAWVGWWQALATGALRFSKGAVPVLCLKMPEAKPGWKGCPGGAAPGAAVSNLHIWNALRSLPGAPSSGGFLSIFGSRRPPTPIDIPPLLHPVRKADADRWLSERFEMMSAERSAAKTAIDALFGDRTTASLGASLRDFVAALAPLYR